MDFSTNVGYGPGAIPEEDLIKPNHTSLKPQSNLRDQIVRPGRAVRQSQRRHPEAQKGADVSTRWSIRRIEFDRYHLYLDGELVACASSPFDLFGTVGTMTGRSRDVVYTS
jgi:hypothetical protein